MSRPVSRLVSQPAGCAARLGSAAAAAAAVAIVLSLAGCQTALLSPLGPVGAAERTLLLDSLAIMLAIVVPTILATLGVAWWFRPSNRRATRRPDFTFSGHLELVVWAIPLMTIVLLGGVTWIGAHELDPAKPLESKDAPLHIQVVSLDWKWLFIYADGQVATLNQVVIPQGVPVRFSLTSASVMSTFFIPRLGSMIYTMNGMATELNLQADQAGVLRGLSAHYNGEGFSDMHFDVRVLPPPAFERWLADTRGAGQTLDGARYTALARPGLEPPGTFGAVEAGLFDRIVGQSLAPGPGPALKNPGAPKPALGEQ